MHDIVSAHQAPHHVPSCRRFQWLHRNRHHSIDVGEDSCLAAGGCDQHIATTP